MPTIISELSSSKVCKQYREEDDDVEDDKPDGLDAGNPIRNS